MPSPLPTTSGYDETSLRFFVGYGEVAGYYSGLAAGLSELGHDVTFVDLAGHPFGYEEGKGLQPRWMTGLCAVLRRILGNHHSGRSARKVAWGVASEAVRWVILMATVTRHDVFVINGARGSTAGYELSILRRLGKRVILVFTGTDARPPYLGSGPIDAPALVRRTTRLRRRLRRLERNADEIVCHGPYAHFFSRPLVKWLAVGMPSHAVEPPTTQELPVTGPIRLLHAPSRPEIKGTTDIRAAVHAARLQGFDVEYVELTARPHSEVMAQLETTHLVCDQLYSDTPMAGLAAEAAGLGVPSLVGGYELDEVRRTEVAAELVPPSFVSHPTAYAESLIQLLKDRDRLHAKGREAAKFMAGPWARSAVADRIVRLAVGGWSDGDRFDPAQIRYVHGVGLSEDRARAMIRAVFEFGGGAALGLDHNPEVKRAVLEFAGLPLDPSH